MKFSVCMCVYGGDNAENFDTAVQSVIQQTLPPSEIILVVDGPVPQSLDSMSKTNCLESFAWRSIKVWGMRDALV